MQEKIQRKVSTYYQPYLCMFVESQAIQIIFRFFLEEEGNKIYNLGQENAFSDATRVYLGKKSSYIKIKSLLGNCIFLLEMQ